MRHGTPSNAWRDIPLLVVTLTIWAYWLRVGAMVVRARRKQHHDVGVIPERPVERAMWLAMVPLVACWCALPWLGLTHEHRSVRAARVRARRAATRRCAGSPPSAAVGCLVLTIQCWRRMGRDWRMDISDRNTSLITDGLFARIRHPIYAFSIAMMIAHGDRAADAADAAARGHPCRADEHQGAQRGGASRADAR